jgi:endonuclease III related protein
MSDLKKRIINIYHKLYQLYGPQGWWPLINHEGIKPGKIDLKKGYHPLNYDLPEERNQIYEVILGTVLTQNTTWIQANQALHNLHDLTGLVAEKLLELNFNILKSAVRPAGFLNQKSLYIQEVTRFYINQEGRIPHRQELIQVKGVGNETADSILLYAYKQPEFVVDTYTRRIMVHQKLVDEKITYLEIKKLFEKSIPVEVPLYQEYHALLVEHAKRYYSKKPYGVGDPLIN